MIRRYKIEKQSLLLPTVCNALPSTVQIEPTNICNLKCPLCVNIEIPKEEQKHLKFEEFKHILSKFNYTIKIFLTGFGEPFLNPDIFKIIELAKSKGHTINLSSNLNIKKNLMKDIIKSGLDTIILSIDGFSQESYSKYRKNSNFSRVIENVQYLNEIKKSCNAFYPVITWQFLVNKYNENEIVQAGTFARESGINIVFKEFGLADDLPEYNFGDIEELKQKWLPSNKIYIRKNYLDKTNNYVADTACPYLWRSISIKSNMKVTPCCFTYKDQSHFGDIAKESLEDIWNNEYYQSARKLFNSDNQSNNLVRTICHNCNNYTKGTGIHIELRNKIIVLFNKFKMKIPSP